MPMPDWLGVERRYTPSMVGIQKMVPAAHVRKMASRPGIAAVRTGVRKRMPQIAAKSIKNPWFIGHGFPKETHAIIFKRQVPLDGKCLAALARIDQW